MTEGRNPSTAIEELYCRTGNGGIHQKIIFSALNIPLCITAFLGNVLIIAALQKASFLHPPSKLYAWLPREHRSLCGSYYAAAVR